MKTIWKTMVVACALFMLGFAFTSCDDDDDERDLPKVSVNLKNPTNSWRTATGTYAQGSIMQHGLFPYFYTTAKNGEEQGKQLYMAIKNGARVIILSPEGVDLAEVNAAIKERIPVILFEEELNVEYTALVQGDNVGAGRNAANYIASKEVEKVAAFRVAQDPTSSNARVGTFLTTIAEAGLETEPIEVTLDMYTREDGRTFTSQLLTEHPDVEAIYAQDDEIALGVLDILKESSDHKVKVVVGCGGARTFLEEISESTDIDLATTLYSPSMITKCVDIAADLLNGKELEEKKIIMPATLINIDNYTSFENQSY